MMVMTMTMIMTSVMMMMLNLNHFLEGKQTSIILWRCFLNTMTKLEKANLTYFKLQFLSSSLSALLQTKESSCIKVEFNFQMASLVNEHCCSFVWVHQYGRRDVMFKP